MKKNKSLRNSVLLFVSLLFLISFVSAGNFNVSSCGTLNTANSIYTLNKTINVTIGISESCLVLNANNITLDGAGYYLNFTSKIRDSNGILINKTTNNTLKNIKIAETIDDSFSSGIYLDTTSNNIISNVSITQLAGGGMGIYLSSSSKNTLSDITITNLSDGVIFLTSPNNLLYNLNFIVIGAGLSMELTSPNNKVYDSSLSAGYDFDLDSGALNTTALNVSYSSESVRTNAQLIRKWYLNTNITDNSLLPLQNANITAYNVSGKIVYSGLTGSDGKTARQELIEYVNNAGVKTYSTPHTITTNKTGFISNSTIYNLSSSNNINHLVKLTPLLSAEIVNPKEQVYVTINNLALDFTITNYTALSTCWFYVLNSSGGYDTSNTTITNCANTTFNVTGAGTYDLYLYLNETGGVTNYSSVSFAVTLSYPAVVLNYPTPAQWFNHNNNIYFNFTATDTDGLGTCELWGNWTGAWNKNYTWINPTNATMNFTKQNISDGFYKFNVWCNDTAGNGGWALTNKTFGTDTLYPTINIISPANGSTINTLIFNVNYSITEINKNNCFFTLRDDTGALHNYGENTTLDCSLTSRTLSTLVYGTFTLQIWARDKAGNLNSTTITFTNTALPSGPGGGGTPDVRIVDKREVVAFADNPLFSGEYSVLDRAIIYAEYFKICTSRYPNQACNLNDEQFTEACNNFKTKSSSYVVDDCSRFYNMYLVDDVIIVDVEKELIDKFDLIRYNEEGIRFLLIINPFKIDTYWLKTRDSWDFLVTANKPLQSCEIVKPEPNGANLTYSFDCIVVPGDTTANIYFKETDTSIFSKNYNALIGWKAIEKDQVYYQQITIRMINLNYQSWWTFGINFAYAIIFYLVIIVILVFVYYNIRKRKIRYINQH